MEGSVGQTKRNVTFIVHLSYLHFVGEISVQIAVIQERKWKVNEHVSPIIGKMK